MAARVRGRRRGDAAPASLVHAVVAWGRLTGGALLFVTAALVVLLVVNLAVLQPRVDDALEATRVLRESHSGMLDQQSGLRGFLLSGDDRFLEAYERGVQVVAEAEPEAAALLSGDGAAGELFLDARLAMQAWLDGWAAPALDSGQSGAGPVNDAFVERDKALFDAYRVAYDELLAELIDRRQRALDTQRLALTIAICATVAATVWGGLVARRRGNELRRAVDEPLAALLHRLERLRGGDLAPQPTTPGPAEFDAIAHGLEETAGALREARIAAARHAADIEARARRQYEVLRFAREVAGNLSLRYVLRGVCVHAGAVAEGARVRVWLISEDHDGLEPCADSGQDDLQPVDLGSVALGDGAVGGAAKHGQVAREQPGGPPELAVPMVVGARVIGVLQLTGGSIASLSDEVVEILETLAVHAGTAIDAARMHELTAEMAVTDVLTGLPNRRRLDRDLAVECTTSVRYGRPLAFLMVDVDHFKSYNDSFGHRAGDVALQRVAAVLAESLRTSDIAYRYGGEEFALMLRETTADDALVLAERLRGAVEHRFSGPSEPRSVTISIGVAGVPEHGSTPEALVAAADAALYEAKRAGRNQVGRA